jgi:DNA-binding MarR family transcriptional regulator
VTEPQRTWAFVTSHGAMLIEVARTPDATVRDLAERAQLTERQAHRVLGDLVEGGYVQRERVGRRNRYRVNEEAPMRHPSFSTHRIGEILDVLRQQ